MKDIKLINIKELEGSHYSSHLNEEIVPYEDIQMIAEKLNEITERINYLSDFTR